MLPPLSASTERATSIALVVLGIFVFAAFTQSFIVYGGLNLVAALFATFLTAVVGFIMFAMRVLVMLLRHHRKARLKE